MLFSGLKIFINMHKIFIKKSWFFELQNPFQNASKHASGSRPTSGSTAGRYGVICGQSDTGLLMKFHRGPNNNSNNNSKKKKKITTQNNTNQNKQQEERRTLTNLKISQSRGTLKRTREKETEQQNQRL